MLGAIAGDIIGSRFEGYAGPPRDFPLFHPACCFTDDSVCTLAVADALLGERDIAASLRAQRRLARSPGTVRGGGACVSSGRIPNDLHSRRLSLASQSDPA